MISIELNNIFRESVKFAKENRHEYLTLEHIFLSILKSTEGSEILSMIGANVEEMKELTQNYIESNNPVMESLDDEEVPF